MASLQSRIDAISYPPTHTYRLDGLVPTRSLASRVATMDRMAPGFFEVGRFLDVGCNKGFFSLLAAQKSKYVLGIDPDEQFSSLCCDLAPENVEIRHCSFGELPEEQEFDSVLVGNGPHYLFREAGGWDYLKKLSALCGGRLLVEGPLSMECADMAQCIPAELQDEFTGYRMEGETKAAGFIKVERKPSPAYTPDRYITLYKKADALLSTDMDGYRVYLGTIYAKIAALVRGTDVVVEIGTRWRDRGILGKEIIPHTEYVMIDREPIRPGLTIDVLEDDFPAGDVVISTAVLHHTEPRDIRKLMQTLCSHTRRLLILEGPNAEEVGLPLGDHKYHLDSKQIVRLAGQFGFRAHTVERTGLTKPHSQLFLVFERNQP